MASRFSRRQGSAIEPDREKIRNLIESRCNSDARTALPTKRSGPALRREIKEELRKNGVQHAIIFGSVARGEDRPDSDIDVYLDFGDTEPSVGSLLKAEGKVLDAFGSQKVDIVSWLDSSRGKRLKQRIEKDGIRVF